MAKDIDSDKIVISKVFNLWFKIPNYQRPYVWEADQVQTLLEDTFDAFTTNCDAQYFLGSLVLKTNSKKEEDGVEYNEYEILDGQQRLTTVLLFFAILRDLTKDNQINDVNWLLNGIDWGRVDNLLHEKRNEANQFITNALE